MPARDRPDFPSTLRRRLLQALALLPLAACAPLAGAAHPLQGRIWDCHGRRWAGREEVLSAAAPAAFVLLGETHDNAEHHRLQGEMLDALLAAGRRPALALEQFDLEHQAAIDAARSRPDASAEDLANAARVDRSGWRWPYYAPLVGRALAAQLPILAANLSREAARRVVREGFGALGEGRSAELALGPAWNPALDTLLREELLESHCGEMPESLVAGLAAAQRARDAVMADTLLRAGERGAVAILGRGHARRDRAVPRYLAIRAPARAVCSIAFTEVEPGQDEPSRYGSRETFDFLWFTGRAERTDPCESLRRRPKAS